VLVLDFSRSYWNRVQKTGPSTSTSTRRTTTLRALGVTIAFAGCAPGIRIGEPCREPAFAPFDGAEPHPAPELPATGVLDQVVLWYQHGGRAAAPPGVGCPFEPTCSVYARQALDRWGPLGVIAIIDRLIVREHPLAAAYYPPICVGHTVRLSDAL
jgi:putative component of membrane protein insertase Oxa1/YidC/SpoIIIJ protein YidD